MQDLMDSLNARNGGVGLYGGFALDAMGKMTFTSFPNSPITLSVESDDTEADVVYEDGPIVVRDKTHETTPMTVGEALHALELVGHDFFLFHDKESDRPTVVYRRHAYDYGLIRLA